ncbi:hypothetical protein J6590_071046 [Homalodisca vitripennis]|nr:hypothetical protein J6590_071046 [Homalodisca vitripennis]
MPFFNLANLVTGLVCAVLVATTSAAPNCCGLGAPCGAAFYGGECCGGLSCGPALTCIAAEFPFPAYGPYGYPYYGYYGGYGYSGPACIGCGCGCDTCLGC